MRFTTTIRTEDNNTCPEYDLLNIIPENIRYGTHVLNDTITGTAIVSDATICYGIANSSTNEVQEFLIYNDNSQKISQFSSVNIFPDGEITLPLQNGTYKMFWNFNKGDGSYLGPNIYCGEQVLSFLSSSAQDGDKGELNFTITDENKLSIKYIDTEEPKVDAQANMYYWWLNAVITKLQ